MAYQSNSLGSVAYKIQSGVGVPASGSGGSVLRIAGGQRGRLAKATYGSNEVRADGMRQRGRHGSRSTNGSYDVEASSGNLDPIFEAVMRGTYSSADLAITQATASLTSITTTSSTIVAAAGSWITAGLAVGDVVRLTAHSTAGNNGKNIPILGLTASTITTLVGLLTADAVADTTFTVTRVGRKLINPAAGSLVKRYFTIDEYESDIDQSETFTDAVWSSIAISMSPDGLITMNPSWVGTGKGGTNASAASPVLTTPTQTTALPLSAVDAAIYYNGTQVLDLTSLNLTIDNKAATTQVIASVTSPDVWTGQIGVSGSFSALRSDLTKMDDFLAETQLSLFILAVENTAEPKSFISIFVPNFTIGAVEKGALSNQAGAMTQTITIPEELVGIDTRGGAFDPTMVKIQVSTAS